MTVKILALETTEKIATVAAAENDRLLLHQAADSSLRSAQSLAPTIQHLLHDVGWRAEEVELVAVTVGPGSFTGLRVGVTTAKVFAYAAGAQVLGVETLAAIAAGAPSDIVRLWTAVDAQRGQWLVRPFVRDGETLQPAGTADLVDAETWLNGLPAGEVLAGPVLRKTQCRLPIHVRTLAPEYWTPSAKHVAWLAWRDYAAGRRDDLWALAPRYSRPSAAEEKLQTRTGTF